MKHHLNAKGFTLIEVMIVVAIIGILAAIAYPSYQDSVQKSRRTDGKSAVVDTAALQEKWYFQHNKFTDDATDLGVTGSQEGFYTVNINQTACGDNGNCFQVVATATGAQVNDTVCRTFSMDHTGNKTAADNNANDTTSICW